MDFDSEYIPQQMCNMGIVEPIYRVHMFHNI